MKSSESVLNYQNSLFNIIQNEQRFKFERVLGNATEFNEELLNIFLMLNLNRSHSDCYFMCDLEDQVQLCMSVILEDEDSEKLIQLIGFFC